MHCADEDRKSNRKLRQFSVVLIDKEAEQIQTANTRLRTWDQETPDQECFSCSDEVAKAGKEGEADADAGKTTAANETDLVGTELVDDGYEEL